MIEGIRLSRADFKESLWSGDGGLQIDGRWHKRGRRIVYTAQSLSLAQLEVLVHIADRRQIPALVYGVAHIPATVSVTTVDISTLPVEWRGFSPYPASTQELGTRWLAEMPTAVLKTPSAVSEMEWNFLLNPNHPEFHRIEFDAPRNFRMDARVF